jgi:hypothetical protein
VFQVALDFAGFKQRLLESGDAELAETARLLAVVFDASTLRPPEDLLARRDEIYDAVRATFPAPFVEKFEAIVTEQEAFWNSVKTGNQALTSSAFKSAFDNLWTAWRRIVHFLPFILMVSINRLNRESVREYAAKELARALYHYGVFYHPSEKQDQREADQRELLIALLELFRQLSHKRLLNAEFFLHPLIGPKGFAGLFPDRFDAHLLLFQQIRNKVVHRQLGDRPAEILADLYRYLEWCFLDLIAILIPICARYYFVYITSIDVKTDRTEALGFTFSGKTGPAGARFLLPPGFQADATKLHFGQLYLMARGKEILRPTESAVRAIQPVTPVDYLDLTPLLVSEIRGRSVLPAITTKAQDLFLLSEYKESEGYLRFLEFAGTALRTVPEGADVTLPHKTPSEADQREASRLIEEVRAFKEAADRLADKLPAIGVGRSVTLESLRAKARQVSRDHLGSVMDADAFDENGKPIAGLRRTITRASFSDKLFVKPREAADVDSFFASPQRGLVLSGSSGAGKSNLLCHAYLELLAAQRPCVFLAGRLLDQPALASFLEAEFAARLAHNWRLTDLDRFLQRNKTTLAVFIDAANEYNHAGGPLELLDKIVNFVEDDNLLKHCQILVSCRSETWAQYRDNRERPLDRAYFYPGTGDALAVSAFESEESRQQLYASYQNYFNLRPADYASLSAPVKAMVRLPFMTALLAETYANATEGHPQSIPADLDYFRLFQKLTERKIADVARLLPPGDQRQSIVPNLVQGCLLAFAQLVYAKLTGAIAEPERMLPAANSSEPSSGGELADALPLDLVFKEERFKPFLEPLAPGSTVSLIDALLQVGLIERVFIPEFDFFGNMTQGRAYKFFHDQYTQFWLAAVYRTKVLGAVAARSLDRSDVLTKLTQGITDLIDRSVNAPVLAGALDHWMHLNMKLDPRGPVDLLMPLQNALAASESGAMRYYQSSMLTGLAFRNILPAEKLYQAVFKDGSPRLRLGLAGAFIDFWPAIPPHALAAMIDACDEDRDQRVLERLGDIFAGHFGKAPRETTVYLAHVIRPSGGLAELAGNLLQRTAFLNQIAFTLRFTMSTTLAQFEHPENMAALRDFIASRYAFIVELVSGERKGGLSGMALEAVRKVIYKKIEAAGIGQWKQFAGSMPLAKNELYFVPGENGIVQRDVMGRFFPYAVAMHNGDFSQISFDPGSDFHQLILRMLNYRVTSVIGYIALVSLPMALCAKWDRVLPLVDELVSLNTASTRFFGTLLMVNLSYTDEAFCGRALGVLHERFLPWMLRDGLEIEWVILTAVGVTDGDFEGQWPALERLIDDVLTHFRDRNDEARATALGDDLLKASFFRRIEIGVKLIHMLLDRGCLDDPVWRTCTLKVMAGMLARDPARLRQALSAHPNSDAVIREARAFMRDRVIIESDRFVGQVNWNRMIARVLISDPKARYLLIKILVGGLAQANSVEDCAREIRRFIVTSVGAYFVERDGEAAKYAHFTVEEAYAELECHHRPGEGEVWSQEADPL